MARKGAWLGLTFFLLLTPAVVRAEDRIYFAEASLPVLAKVVEVSEDTITVHIPRKGVDYLFMRSLDPKGYEDTIQLREPEVKLRGKVMGLTDSHVVARFPRNRIKEVRVDLAQAEQPAPIPRAERPQTSLILPEERRPEPPSRLETQVKELDEKVSLLQRRMKENIRLEVEKEVKEQGGTVTGRILWSGKPLPGARIKIVRLTELGLAESFRRLAGFRGPEKPITLEAVTDEKGIYKFDNVPPGGYDIYWKATLASSWIRRFDTEADLTVTSKNKLDYKDIEANVSTVN